MKTKLPWFQRHGLLKCYWPPYSSKKVQDAIKNGKPPEHSWSKFNIAMFRNNVFETFKEANQKSIKATYTSDLESQTEKEQEPQAFSSKNRKIIRKVTSYSSVESVEDEDNQSICDPPKFKKSLEKSHKNDRQNDHLIEQNQHQTGGFSNDGNNNASNLSFGLSTSQLQTVMEPNKMDIDELSGKMDVIWDLLKKI